MTVSVTSPTLISRMMRLSLTRVHRARRFYEPGQTQDMVRMRLPPQCGGDTRVGNNPRSPCLEGKAAVMPQGDLPLIFDAHLDLAWNALDWNRDLLLPVEVIRSRERATGLSAK